MSASSYFSKTKPIIRPKLVRIENIMEGKHEKLKEFKAGRNLLFYEAEGKIFLGLNNKLMISQNLKTWKTVLKAENGHNIFWHMTRTKDGEFFAHEYGAFNTSIYSTYDCERWQPVVKATEIDKNARHFHSIAYDRYRDMLIVTLGDGNIVKVATSKDGGQTWRPVYTGAYQCLPIVVLKDRIVFGMDSGISRGLVVWWPKENMWRTIHFKNHNDKPTRDMLQSSDLKLLDNGVWLMSSGGGSLMASRDLKNWCFLRIGQKGDFEAHMISNQKYSLIAIALEYAAMIISKEELAQIVSNSAPDVKPCYGLKERIKGICYVAKRKIFSG